MYLGTKIAKYGRCKTNKASRRELPKTQFFEIMNVLPKLNTNIYPEK